MKVLNQDLIKTTAQKNGWDVWAVNEEHGVLSLTRPADIAGSPRLAAGDQRVDVYYETSTVAVCPNQTLHGNAVLWRHRVTWERLRRLLKEKPPSPYESLLHGVNLTKQDVFYRPVHDFGWAEPKLTKRYRKLSSSLIHDQEANDCLSKGHGNLGPDTTSVVALGSNWVAVNLDGCIRFGGRDRPKKLKEQGQEQHQKTTTTTKTSFPHLPKLLDVKLRNRSVSMPHVTCLAFGPQPQSFFCQFADGYWLAQGLPADLMAALIKKKHKHGMGKAQAMVQSLAVGPNDSYVCIWKDSSYDWSDVPDSLHMELSDGKAKYDDDNGDEDDKDQLGVGAQFRPVEVHIGSNDEWFLRFFDGSWKCWGHSDECDEAIEDIKNEGGTVVNLHFGHGSMWLIEYEHGDDL